MMDCGALRAGGEKWPRMAADGRWKSKNYQTNPIVSFFQRLNENFVKLLSPVVAVWDVMWRLCGRRCVEEEETGGRGRIAARGGIFDA